MERMKLTKCDPVKQARTTEFLNLEQRSEPPHRQELDSRKRRSTPTGAASSTAIINKGVKHNEYNRINRKGKRA